MAAFPGHPQNNWLHQLKDNSNSSTGDLWRHAICHRYCDAITWQSGRPGWLHDSNDDEDDNEWQLHGKQHNLRMYNDHRPQTFSKGPLSSFPAFQMAACHGRSFSPMSQDVGSRTETLTYRYTVHKQMLQVLK